LLTGVHCRSKAVRVLYALASCHRRHQLMFPVHTWELSLPVGFEAAVPYDDDGVARRHWEFEHVSI